jgi:predicted dehydrogenase
MSKDKQLAVLVGCGGISRAWLNPIATFDEIDVVGLVDLDLESCKKINEEFELNATTGTDMAQVIKDTGATLVLDCTIPEAHARVALTAFENGCDVLTEKPMTATMEEAVAVVNAAEETGKLYAVIQNRRYLDTILKYKNTIENAELGDITTLNADFYLAPRFGGFRDEMDHVLLLDMSIHTFDQARFLCGQNAVSAYCHEWNPKSSWYHHGASAVVIFEMDGGAVFTYRGSWCADGLPTSWESEWRAICERGTAKWDGNNGIAAATLTKNDDGGWVPKTEEVAIEELDPLEHSGHTGVIREYLDCMSAGTLPQTHGKDNIQSLAMVHAAIKSAQEGRKVMVSEFFDHA